MAILQCIIRPLMQPNLLVSKRFLSIVYTVTESGLISTNFEMQ